MNKTMLTLLAMSSSVSAATLQPQLDAVTVSGLSSGGYMANQFHIAHSDWVKGAGLIGSGPYYCGQNSIAVALGQCVSKQDKPIDLPKLAKQAQDWQNAGKIAPLAGLKNSKVWIFHGSKDDKVIEPVTDALNQQYVQWSGQQNVRYIKDRPFAHHFPTVSQGSDCSTSQAPFVGNCDYDAAGEMLNYLLSSSVKAKANATGQLIEIDQQDLGGDPASGMADNGYLYVPDACAAGQACKVHVNFHGCNQFADAVGTEYMNQNGLHRWADAHSMLILYPQAKASMLMPLNPQGCWDWWGYTGDDYATRDGQQVKAVANMLNALSGLEVESGSEK